MGNTSSELSAEDKAAADAKHAQVILIKSALLKKVEDHEERLHAMEVHGDPHLGVFREELMNEVDQHLKEHATMEEEQKQLAQFKEELMAKVEEHTKEIHQAEDKAKGKASKQEEIRHTLGTLRSISEMISSPKWNHLTASNSVFLTFSCGPHERRNAQKGRRTLDECGVVSQLDAIVLLRYRFRAAKEGS